MDDIRLLVDADIPVADRILQAAHKVDFSFAPLLRRNCALTAKSYWLLEVDGHSIGVVGYTDFEQFAHIGLMAIHPSHQIGGAGSRLLTYALEQLEGRGFRSITLYSTDSGLAFYPKYGFQWSGLSTEWQLRKRKLAQTHCNVRPLNDVAQIAAFDAPIFGGNRESLFRSLLHEFPGRALMATGSDGECCGFAFAQSAVIGPIAAASPEVAVALIDAAIGMDFSSTPRVILPEAHRDGETVLLKLGFEPTRTSRYFVRGQPPCQQRQRMYGQAAYSLG